MAASSNNTKMPSPTPSVIDKIGSMSTLGIAIWISVLVHLTFISIKFQPEIKKALNKLPPLEVVLVNAKTQSAPDKADAIAQANLDRGGNTDQNRQMKTALPAPKDKSPEVKLKSSTQAQSAAKAAKLKSQEESEQQRVAALEKKAQELMTQAKALQKVESNPTQNAASSAPDKGTQKTVVKTLNRDAMLAAAAEMDRLEAQIAKQQEEYQKRPKKRYLGARTKEAMDALYLDSWRQKIEKIGNNNYPAAAREQKLYGQLRMTVEVKSDGSIEKITIDKSSGNKILDEAAKNIVMLSAPFAVFPPQMKKTTDILGITRTWTFTQEDTLSTQDAN